MRYLLFLFVFFCLEAQSQNLSVDVSLVDAYPPKVDDEYLDIYLLMGQSNAQGRAATSLFSNDAYSFLQYQQRWWGATGFIMNQAFNGTYFDTLQAGVNTGDVSNFRWGVQPAWFNQLLRYKNRDLYMIQNAIGGLPISLWDSATSGYMYDSLVAMVGRANAYATSIGKTARYKCAVWWQYEQDVFAATDSTVYINALRGVINVTRRLTGNLSMPFVIVKGLPCQTSTNFNAQMGNIQEIVGAEAFNILIPQTGTETCADAAHADGATYVLKSNQIFQLIKNL